MNGDTDGWIDICMDVSIRAMTTKWLIILIPIHMLKIVHNSKECPSLDCLFLFTLITKFPNPASQLQFYSLCTGSKVNDSNLSAKLPAQFLIQPFTVSWLEVRRPGHLTSLPHPVLKCHLLHQIHQRTGPLLTYIVCEQGHC